MIIKSFGWHVDPNLWYHKIENLVKIECIPSIPAFQFFYSKHHLMRLFCVFPILCFASSYQSYSCILPFLYFEFLHIFGTEIQYIPQVWIIPSSNHKEMKSCSHFIKDYIRTNPSLILANKWSLLLWWLVSFHHSANLPKDSNNIKSLSVVVFIARLNLSRSKFQYIRDNPTFIVIDVGSSDVFVGSK